MIVELYLGNWNDMDLEPSGVLAFLLRKRLPKFRAKSDVGDLMHRMDTIYFRLGPRNEENWGVWRVSADEMRTVLGHLECLLEETFNLCPECLSEGQMLITFPHGPLHFSCVSDP